MTMANRQRWSRNVLTAGRYVLVMGVFVAFWDWASLRSGNPILLPRPVQVGREFLTMLRDGELPAHIVFSLKRLLFSYSLAGLAGISAGVLMGLNRFVYAALRPLVEMLRPISGIAWIPLALYFFGVGEMLPRYLIFYSAIFPFILNTMAGVQSVDQNLIAAARTMGASRSLIVREVILPGALPLTLVGARVAMGVAWMSLVAAELVGAPSGLGFVIEWNRQLLMTGRVMVGMATIGFLGYLSDRVTRAVGRRLAPWWEGAKG